MSLVPTCLETKLKHAWAIHAQFSAYCRYNRQILLVNTAFYFPFRCSQENDLLVRHMSARWNIFKLSDKKEEEEEEPFLSHITIWFSSSNRHSTHDTFVLERKEMGGGGDFVS